MHLSRACCRGGGLALLKDEVLSKLPMASLHADALLAQLNQCSDELAAATAGLRDEPLTPELRLVFVLVSIVLVLFAGLMAGLTLGLLSLDS